MLIKRKVLNTYIIILILIIDFFCQDIVTYFLATGKEIVYENYMQLGPFFIDMEYTICNILFVIFR